MGTVDLPCHLLLGFVYQSTEKPRQATAAMATPPWNGSPAPPKTLRIRFDFAPPIERRLTEFLLRRDLGSSPNLLRNCYLFVNVEPVWRVRSRGHTTTEVGAKDLLPAPSITFLT
ncbi:unnamed protein product [Dibothriocephalus latus]|uniref:Uncharacterized protein n=1 Tax=Dibothriocephalus latus TaxID=60516 RepID=A0A3P7MYM7_DIBLA|nr:unnamed protein product [Dibothriocephalus latus]